MVSVNGDLHYLLQQEKKKCALKSEGDAPTCEECWVDRIADLAREFPGEDSWLFPAGLPA